MTSNKHKNFAESLQHVRKTRGLSLAAFSKELDIPKSTLQSILEDGQTSLHTAMQISEKLAIPLDVLIHGTASADQFKMLNTFLIQMEWYSRLPQNRQEEAREYLMALIRMIQEGTEI